MQTASNQKPRCVPIQSKTDGMYYCSVCGWGPQQEPFLKGCDGRKDGESQNSPRNAVKQPLGPGDYLHDMIKHWTGEDIQSGCNCRFWIATMNAWGPDGCREHLDEIVAHMLEEAKKRGWKLAGLPGAKTVAGLAVRRACRMAEKAAKS